MGSVDGLVEGGEQRVDGAERVRVEQLRGVDLGHVVGAVELVEGAELVGDLADGPAPLVARHASASTG